MTELKWGGSREKTPVGGTFPEGEAGEKWYKRAYRRNVVDMHIADWSDTFLSEFNPTIYVATLRKSLAQSAVLYAHSHVGLTYYPTKHGCMHLGLKGRNLFSETAAECRKHGTRACGKDRARHEPRAL